MATSSSTTSQAAAYVFRHDPTHATYQWDCIGGSGRVGPQNIEIRDLMNDDDVRGPQNQCVFIRTIALTLPGEVFDPVEVGVSRATLFTAIFE